MSLYVRDGAYHYRDGYNLPAISATLIGAAVALAGMFWAPLHPIYDWSWFVGFGLAGALYWGMMQGRVPPPPAAPVPDARIAPPR